MKLVRGVVFGVMLYLLIIAALAGLANAGPIVLDGLIEPSMIVNVGSSVAGILKTVAVDRGDFVKKGQVLATLQSGVEKATVALARARAEFTASIELRRARLKFARQEQLRADDLYSKEAIPLQEKEEAETNRLIAQGELEEAIERKQLAGLELEQAREVLKRRTIRSPVTGVVVERFLCPGEFVEDQPILKVAQIKPLNVEVIIPVSFLGSIKVGMHGTVKHEGPMGGVYVAEVKVVDRVVDAASGTFGVRLELPNPDYSLPAGLKCEVLFLDE